MFGFLFRKKAFEGLPFDSNTYYAGGQAERTAAVKQVLGNLLSAGGVQGVRVEPWTIRMRNWFSGYRDYVVVRYEGVWVYVLIQPFGQDLYACWISFFKLGCLQRLIRFGRMLPNDLDVDDLAMAGQAVDLYLRQALDQVLRGAGAAETAVAKVLATARRKQYIQVKGK